MEDEEEETVGSEEMEIENLVEEQKEDSDESDTGDIHEQEIITSTTTEQSKSKGKLNLTDLDTH